MDGRNNLNELLDVLEGIRKEKYPHISPEIIREIVTAQYENQDKRLEARNQTNRIVTEYLNKMVKQEEK